MRPIILLLLFFSYGFSQQQDNQRFQFTYDASGNQVTSVRTVNINNSNRVAENTEFEKFFTNDEFSYYPNPTKELLFLKWENVNAIPVTLSLFDINGKMIRNIDILQSETEISISFVDMPVGTYVLLLNYKNSESKSIKILKN